MGLGTYQHQRGLMVVMFFIFEFVNYDKQKLVQWEIMVTLLYCWSYGSLPIRLIIF